MASKSSESKGDDRSEIPGEAAAAALLTRIASGTTQCESRQAEVAAGSLYHAMLGVGAAIKAKEITLRKRDFIRAVASGTGPWLSCLTRYATLVIVGWCE